MDAEEEEHHCHECNKHFIDSDCLKAHVRKIHTNKDKLKCECCGYTTNYKDKLARHSKTHNKSDSSGKNFACPLCSTFQSYDRSVMKHHYTEVHNVSLEIENLEFKNKNDFMAWKGEKEEQEVCRFIVVGGPRKKSTTINQEFRCFRDGFYICRGKGVRHLKIKGSHMIDGICPASMKTSQDVNTSIVRVKYCATHVGHVAELGRLNLTKQEKDKIAGKIAGKIPFDAILDDIRDSITDSRFERINLITRKDLWNIEQTYNLSEESVRHSNDCTSVESWIEQMKEETSIIRFYKAQGSITPTYPDLKEDDFVLIIANNAQLDMLKNHGSDIICFDSTHGMNQYGFELTTLLVLDELRQGFPTAFMISSRTDTQTVSLFASVLRFSLECPIEALVLMSDMAEIFYKGWCNVMPTPKNWLFCTWHVDRAWRKNLNKISCIEKRSMVYKTLRTLLEETDEHVFPLLLARGIKAMKDDPQTASFGKYFEEEYSKKYSSWAFSHRKYCGINTNMHIENMHRVMKHIYLKGKKVKRLDKALHALMRFTRDKLYDLIIVKTRGKLTPKIVDIRQRHRKALEMNDCVIIITQEGWSAASQSGRDIYNIVRMDAGDCDCRLKCDECSICIHSFRCTCVDSSIKWNICKHIHRVCLFLRDSGEASSQPVVPDSILVGELDICVEEGTVPTAIVQELTNHKQLTCSINEERKKISQIFTLALNEANSVAELNIVRHAVLPILPTIRARRSEISYKHTDDAAKKKPVNPTARVSPQKSFFSNKQKKKNSSTARMSKPSEKERMNVAANLLLGDPEEP